MGGKLIPQSLGTSIFSEPIVADPDGSGPIGDRLYWVIGTSIREYDGASWNVLPAPGTAGQTVIVGAWDTDNDSSTTGVLHALARAPGGGPLALYRYDGASWSTVKQFAFFDATGIQSADFDGPGSEPASLMISRPTQLIALKSNLTEVSSPVNGGFPAVNGNTRYEVVDLDDDGPLPQRFFAIGPYQGDSNRSAIFEYDPAGFDGLFWIARGANPGNTGGSSDISPRGITQSLTSADLDGPGPLPVRLYSAETVAADRPFGVSRWDGATAWITSDPDQPYGPVTTWDADGAGPGLPVVVTANGTGIYRREASVWTPIAEWFQASSGSPVAFVDLQWLDIDGDGPQTPALYGLTGAGFGRHVPRNSSNIVNVFKRVGTTWERQGNEQLYNVRMMVDANGALFVANTINGLLWMLDSPTGTWQYINTGLSSVTNTGIVFDADGAGPLPARFTTTSGRDVVQWTGSSWSTITTVPLFATTTGFAFTSMCTWDADGSGPNPPLLVVGGSRFRTAGSAGYIGAWNGSTWQIIGDMGTLESVSGTAPFVWCMDSWDPDGNGPLNPRLLVGGPITGGSSGASLVPTNQGVAIMSWNGSNWMHLPGSEGPYFTTLFTWDRDGQSGPLLATPVRGGSTSKIWNGSAFVPLAGALGLSAAVASSGYDPDGPGPVKPKLLLSSGTPSPFALTPDSSVFAISLGCAAGCGLSDVAGANQAVGMDGALTADDIIVFLGWFFALDARSDVAGPNQSTVPDGAFTADDIIVFLGQYFAGCQ